MTEIKDQYILAEANTSKIGCLIKKHNIDLFGFADLSVFKDTSNSSFIQSIGILENYKYAIVMAAQYGKLGKQVNGDDLALFLEEIAFKLMMHLTEKEKHAALIIHTEDEFDPEKRMCLISLKALAKEAGIGWQGRSLLIVTPDYGPVHRLIAILTDMPLVANNAIANKCADCCLCVEKCPYNALKRSQFIDYPKNREDVLDINKCNGDNGCMVCIAICPWMKIK